jgi:hypothetical protein
MRDIITQNDKKFDITCSDRVPICPYRFEKEINEDYAYIIDGVGIVWIREVKGIYDAPCLRCCVDYIVCADGYYNYLTIKKHIREHLIPGKEKAYNAELGKYDGVWDL